MKASDFDPQLDALNQRSVGRLMNAEVFDRAAFTALYSYLCEKAVLIKLEHVVSKQVLSVLLGAQKAIESRAEYNMLVRENTDLCREFAMLLDLIVCGEDCRDRSAGVPRIL